ncbi:putative spermidine/putrescine transport system substrate-binding protein [Enhydrobacter aerosaccus]|uniref:Putative spermidine/putrescine transport system substrate-binding protein n=1 Tax=Enhydrobacter aerosaccus TaxID=225324 RepID=A0A1T4QGE8_9HYPH|nr:extracellular solute-binding protein [Enhydrobacter aerosaccus]SKA02789.1 putative spermidine/putrescine transport system substrate-binding protein [Enhydrobacter aerosaccus]
MSGPFPLRRRTLLGGAAALALGAPQFARAQDNKRIVVGTWGGDYSRLLAKNIEKPFLEPKGWDVVKDEANDPPRRAKMLAEKTLRRGTSDVQGLSAANMYEANEQGLLEQLDYSKIPLAKNLMPMMKYPYGIGQIYSGKVILYNPKLLSTPPTSFAETFDPKMGSKLGIIDIQYQYTLVAAGMAGGGSPSNIEPGKALLLACKKAGARIYPSNEAFAQAMKTEEIAIGIMWKARAVQWQNAGIPIETAAAKEGVPMYISGFAMPKNAPDKPGAYAYLNAMLEPAAQEAFAVDMGYNPTVTNANVPADVQKRIGFTPEEQKRLVDLDYGYLAKNDVAFQEWWNKSFKG